MLLVVALGSFLGVVYLRATDAPREFALVLFVGVVGAVAAYFLQAPRQQDQEEPSSTPRFERRTMIVNSNDEALKRAVAEMEELRRDMTGMATRFEKDIGDLRRRRRPVINAEATGSLLMIVLVVAAGLVVAS